MADRLEEIKARHFYGYLHSEKQFPDRAWLIEEIERLREKYEQDTALIERQIAAIDAFEDEVVALRGALKELVDATFAFEVFPHSKISAARAVAVAVLTGQDEK